MCCYDPQLIIKYSARAPRLGTVGLQRVQAPTVFVNDPKTTSYSHILVPLSLLSNQ